MQKRRCSRARCTSAGCTYSPHRYSWVLTRWVRPPQHARSPRAVLALDERHALRAIARRAVTVARASSGCATAVAGERRAAALQPASAATTTKVVTSGRRIDTESPEVVESLRSATQKLSRALSCAAWIRVLPTMSHRTINRTTQHIARCPHGARAQSPGIAFRINRRNFRDARSRSGGASLAEREGMTRSLRLGMLSSSFHWPHWA